MYVQIVDSYYLSIVASLPAPTALDVSSPTPTSITLTWEQPEGAGAVDRYEIIYDRIINECGAGMGSLPTVAVVLDDGSLRSYTLTNSYLTPVDEDTMYFMTLRAVNSVTRSDTTMAFPSPVTTADAGLLVDFTVASVCYALHITFSSWIGSVSEGRLS